MSRTRRRWLKGAASLVVAPLAARWAHSASDDAASQSVVQLVARRFHFEPSAIALKAGQESVIEITSIDFVHGFKIPALKMRSDLPPGRITTVRVKFDKPGNYAFLCDNFCGIDHEEMAGKFVVT